MIEGRSLGWGWGLLIGLMGQGGLVMGPGGDRGLVMGHGGEQDAGGRRGGRWQAADLEAAVEVVSGEQLKDNGAQGVVLRHPVQRKHVEAPQVQGLREKAERKSHLRSVQQGWGGTGSLAQGRGRQGAHCLNQAGRSWHRARLGPIPGGRVTSRGHLKHPVSSTGSMSCEWVQGQSV